MGKLKRNVDCFYCNRRSEQTEKPTPSDRKQAGGELKAGSRRQQAPPLPSAGDRGRGALAALGPTPSQQSDCCAQDRPGGLLSFGERVLFRSIVSRKAERPRGGLGNSGRIPRASPGGPAASSWAAASGRVCSPGSPSSQVSVPAPHSPGPHRIPAWPGLRATGGHLSLAARPFPPAAAPAAPHPPSRR